MALIIGREAEEEGVPLPMELVSDLSTRHLCDGWWGVEGLCRSGRLVLGQRGMQKAGAQLENQVERSITT